MQIHRRSHRQMSADRLAIRVAGRLSPIPGCRANTAVAGRLLPGGHAIRREPFDGESTLGKERPILWSAF